MGLTNAERQKAWRVPSGALDFTMDEAYQSESAKARVAEVEAKLKEVETNIKEGVVSVPRELGRAVVEVLSVRPGDLVPANQPILRVLRILKRNHFDGVMIPDHTPQMTCAAPWHAGMAHTLGYMLAAKAILESATDKSSGKSRAASGDK